MKINQNIKSKPILDVPTKLRLDFNDFIGNRLKVNLEEWLLKAIDNNPAIIGMFKLRENNSQLNLDIWSGEYLGKFLIGAILCWKINRNKPLKELIEQIIIEISKIQGIDGYLGPFSKDKRFFGIIKKFIKSDWLELSTFEGTTDIHRILKTIRVTPLYEGNVCDLWGHYHIMLGLWYWYCETGNKQSYKICIKAADLICNIFLDSKKAISDAGSYEFNMAIIHIFCLLYKKVSNPKYLKIINKIESEWNKEGAGNYLASAIIGKEFFEIPRPRWESLHSIQALAELYYITGDEKYRKAFEHFYWSIVKYDRHNTGGFSSGEQARGNPYDPRVIETCATIAWITLNVDMLRLTGNSAIADELELSTFNAMIGSQSKSGRWWTYNTPMDGFRKAFYQDVNWQCLPGGPELNCCYTNASRGLGILSEWAILKSDNKFMINYYGPCSFEFLLPSGNYIKIVQETIYPKNGQIVFKILLRKSEKFALNLRIPNWSKNTFLAINNKKFFNITPGKYFSIDRVWGNNDIVHLKLDMDFHFWIGDNECSGKTSIYTGPILLSFDEHFNSKTLKNLQTIHFSIFKNKFQKIDQEDTWLLFKFSLDNKNNLFLCDFASAGSYGSYYKTWLTINELPKDGLKKFFNFFKPKK